MGAGASRPDLRTVADLPPGERYFGLENFGATCYANSVLQALYFCAPFRRRVLAYAAARAAAGAPGPETLLSCLAELFAQIAGQRKRTGCVSPRRFVARLRADNELFSSAQHQDAHEFLNYLLNEVGEALEREAREARGGGAGGGGAAPAANGAGGGTAGANGGMHARSPSLQELTAANGGGGGAAAAAPPSTWVADLFRGRLVNETRCLGCEATTSREEAFYDLSLEVEANASVSACLRRFSATEALGGADKFFCDACGCLQEARKGLRLAAPPPVLCLHLKRFKYAEAAGRLRKLGHRVAFPAELKVPGPAGAAADAPYDLTAVVVHMGAQPYHGHYVALVRSGGRWVCFDDDAVHVVSEAQVRSTFGAAREPGARDGAGAGGGGGADHAYILVYQRRGFEGEEPPPPAAA